MDGSRGVPVSDGLGRNLSLSDAVFAIAMTLLVIDVTLPPGTTSENLGTQLASLGGSYFAYVLSFFVIGRFWLVHHRAFRRIQTYDDRFLILNLLFLMFIAFLPFPTSVLGHYGDSSAAAVTYAIAVCLTSATWGICWRYATGKAALVPTQLKSRINRTITIANLGSTGLFVVSIPVALASPMAAEIMWVLGFLFIRLLVGRLTKHARGG